MSKRIYAVWVTGGKDEKSEWGQVSSEAYQYAAKLAKAGYWDVKKGDK